VVGLDGVDDVGRFPVLLGQVGADEGVGPLDLVVHGLADVVEQAGPLGPLDVEAEFRGHHAGQGRHFQECCSTFWE